MNDVKFQGGRGKNIECTPSLNAPQYAHTHTLSFRCTSMARRGKEGERSTRESQRSLLVRGGLRTHVLETLSLWAMFFSCLKSRTGAW